MPFIRQGEPIEQLMFADEDLVSEPIPAREPWDLGIDDEAAIEADLPEPGWDWDRECRPYWEWDPADWKEYWREMLTIGAVQ